MKKVIVTGASRGIGRAIAQMFFEKGYIVYANYKNTPIDYACTKAVYADVSVQSDVAKMHEQIGEVDIVINNAGIAQEKLFCDITENDWDNMINTNLKSVFTNTKAFLPNMLKNHSGCIINISSIWGLDGGAMEVHYAASKAGVIGITKALSQEVAPSGVRVNAIAPGVIDTDMTAVYTAEEREVLLQRTDLRCIGKPLDIAHTALYLAENEFITGQVIEVSGGFR